MLTLQLRWIATFLFLAAWGCASAPQASAPTQGKDYAQLIYGELPTWARNPTYSGYYLNISKVRETERISYRQIVELQDRMRVHLADLTISIAEAYEKALADVRAGQFTSGWKGVSSVV